jgi:energy-coupling factor transport system ATP-binding protein
VRLVYEYAVQTGEDTVSRRAVDEMSLDIEKGSFIAIVGQNGSGKSTFAKHINGILTPTEGKMYVYGMDTGVETNVQEIRQKVGMVFQNPDNQIIGNVVEEDVAFGPENLGLDSEEIRRRVSESLALVNMSEHRKKSPNRLSGGQKQRVSIAGVLAMKSNCIVLDEPTAMLDPQGRREVLDLIGDLKKEGITVILITHHMEEAVLADRVGVVGDGRVVLDDSPQNIFSQVDVLKSLGLDVPQVMELADELRKEGVPLDAGILSINELVDALCQLN